MATRLPASTLLQTNAPIPRRECELLIFLGFVIVRPLGWLWVFTIGRSITWAATTVMTSSIFCTGDLEDTEMSFHYTVAQFALGDVFVSGGIFGEYTEVTNSTMYSLYQNGYHQAPITFTHDSLWDHNGGFWEISLDRGTLVTTIDYQDIDGDVSWEMVPEDCVVNTY